MNYLKTLMCLTALLPNLVLADLPTVKMIATGGTIAMKIDPVKNAPVPAISGEDLLATVPEIRAVAHIEVDNISNIPSDYMMPSNWVALYQSVTVALARDDIAGVIISHGTDTLEESAYFLDLTVDSKKPVVLIGAQRNASEKDFDGPRNLLNAVRVAVSPKARNKGAMIVMNNQINAAREATKSHTSDVESFKSGDYGYLGRVNPDRIVFFRESLRRQHLTLQEKALPDVKIIPMYAGADGSMVKSAVAIGAKGIVIQALGMGNVNKPVFAEIKQAIAKGITVVISTRVPNGEVLPVYGFEGGGNTLQDAGAIFAGDLSSQKARILLMLALQAELDADHIQQLFRI